MGGAARMRLGSAAAMVGTVLLLTSCSSASTSAPPASTVAGTTATTSSTASSGGPLAGARSARDAVAGYLRAVNAHDAVTARAYMAPEYQQARAGQVPRFEDWVANVASVSLRPLPPGVTATGLKGQYPRYRDVTEFSATYDIVFHTVSATETSGPQTRFFIVGHNHAQATWLILSIGTGP